MNFTKKKETQCYLILIINTILEYIEYNLHV